MNTQRMILGALGVVVATTGLLGCAGEMTAESMGDELGQDESAGGDVTPSGKSATYGSGTSGKLVYHNSGKMITSVQLHALYWGSTVESQDSFDDFYDAIT